VEHGDDRVRHLAGPERQNRRSPHGLRTDDRGAVQPALDEGGTLAHGQRDLDLAQRGLVAQRHVDQ
jgi:hypothetical protein